MALGQKMELAQDILDESRKLATLTAGFSGADLQTLLYSAQLISVKQSLANSQQRKGEKGELYCSLFSFLKEGCIS